MARTNGEMIRQAFDMKDSGLTGVQIAEALHNKNIGAYLRLKETLENGEMPPYAGSKYSLPACKDFIENYLNKPEAREIEQVTECDSEALRIRISFELGETARKAIDGLLALVGVKL